MIFKIGDEVFLMRDNHVARETIAAVIQIEQKPAGKLATHDNPHVRHYHSIEIESRGSCSNFGTVVVIEAEKQTVYVNALGMIITDAFATKQELLESL